MKKLKFFRYLIVAILFLGVIVGCSSVENKPASIASLAVTKNGKVGPLSNEPIPLIVVNGPVDGAYTKSGSPGKWPKRSIDFKRPLKIYIFPDQEYYFSIFLPAGDDDLGTINVKAYFAHVSSSFGDYSLNIDGQVDDEMFDTSYDRIDGDEDVSLSLGHWTTVAFQIKGSELVAAEQGDTLLVFMARKVVNGNTYEFATVFTLNSSYSIVARNKMRTKSKKM